MICLWAILLVLLNTLWLGCSLFYLPGNWLIVITTILFAWWQAEKDIFSIAVLVVIVLLAVLGEIIEFSAGFLGVKTAGGSRRASITAVLGAITGAILATFLIPIPIIGTLLGACGGACAGAGLAELSTGRERKASIASGISAGLAQFLGLHLKILIGVIIYLIVALAAFIP
jgi:uncharacterized protein YqgC (DUF456 family)